MPSLEQRYIAGCRARSDITAALAEEKRPMMVAQCELYQLEKIITEERDIYLASAC